MSPIAADSPEPSAWDDACRAAHVLAQDPAGFGGVWLRARSGPVRDRWLAGLRDALTEGASLAKVPLHATDERLLGGLDLAATLRAGRPVAERGILAATDGGIVVLPSAERTEASTAARLAAVLDTGEVAAERDGMALRSPARIGVVALDEGIEPDERLPGALADRLAFHLDLSSIAPGETLAAPIAPVPADGTAAPGTVAVPEDLLEALCGAASAYGIASLRAPILALRVARASASLAGRAAVAPEDAGFAARLVLAPRATRLPAEAADPGEPPDDAPPPPDEREGDGREETSETPPPLDDLVLAAIAAAIPPGLLERLRLASAGGRSGAAGSGAEGRDRRRGRPAGTLRGEPVRGARLNLVETLRAAAPWQPLRRRGSAKSGEASAPHAEVAAAGGPRSTRDRGASFEAPWHGAPQDEEVGRGRTDARTGGATRLAIRRDDLRITRYRRRAETTTVFVVDASGSAAFQRLAEAKGAVELLLADCYARRDRVALLSFRGAGADLLLPPTRSLARAKRCLAALPGGGGTPLAAAIDDATALAETVARAGGSAMLVFLTDGRANVGRDGRGGREGAVADALAAAARLRAGRAASLFIDTSPRPQAGAAEIAAAMGARYLPLPSANAELLSGAVRHEMAAGSRAPGR